VVKGIERNQRKRKEKKEDLLNKKEGPKKELEPKNQDLLEKKEELKKEEELKRAKRKKD
tara:strand:- start:260 stop:436 length:177 start_codon:yes stop_codon:yes gene_type:complete